MSLLAVEDVVFQPPSEASEWTGAVMLSTLTVGPTSSTVDAALSTMSTAVRLRRSVRSGGVPCTREVLGNVRAALDALGLLSAREGDGRPAALALSSDPDHGPFLMPWGPSEPNRIERSADVNSFYGLLPGLYDAAPSALLLGWRFDDPAPAYPSALARVGVAAYAAWLQFVGHGVDGCLYMTPNRRAHPLFEEHFSQTRHLMTLTLRGRPPATTA